MNRNEWKQQDGENRAARRRLNQGLDSAELLAPMKGRDTGYRRTQEQRLAAIRPHALRDLHRPDDPPTPPAVAASMAACGRTPFRHTRAWAVSDYRQRVRFALANSGIAAAWMIERALRCELEVRATVQTLERAA